jgi:hypothetical protein
VTFTLEVKVQNIKMEDTVLKIRLVYKHKIGKKKC